MLSGFLFIASMMGLFLNTHLSITMILFVLFDLTLSLETREVRKHRDAYTIKENLETNEEETGTKPAQIGFTTKKIPPCLYGPYTQQE